MFDAKGARKAATKLWEAGFSGVEIRQAYPELTYRVTGHNRCGMARSVESSEELAREIAEAR